MSNEMNLAESVNINGTKRDKSYKGMKELSHGVYGKVYHCNDDTVIKLVDKLNSKKTRFCRQNLQEAVFLSHFKHPNIVRLKNINIEGDNVHMYLEKCDVSLYDFIKETRIEDRIMYLPNILHQLLDALVYLHKKCLVHGDFKPDNIMINRQTKQVKLIDWGGLMTFRHYKYNDNICTHEYCPPEGWTKLSTHHPITPKFDVWSLGLTLYFYLTGAYYYNFEKDDEENYIQELKTLSQNNEYLPFEDNIRTTLKKKKIDIDEDMIRLMKNMLCFSLDKRASSDEIVIDPYFKEFNKVKFVYNYSHMSHKPFLLKGVKKNYDNKFRRKAINLIYNLTTTYKIPEVLCLSVTLLDRYLLAKRQALATYNYKMIAFVTFKISSLLITDIPVYFEDYVKDIDKEETKKDIINRLIMIGDDILIKLNFKVYTDTFDWTLYRKKTNIDYNIIYDIMLNYQYHEKQNQELTKLYYNLRTIKENSAKKKII